MRNLIKHIQNTNAREHMWSRGDTFVLGVSGGADSMCLLHLFAALAQKEHLTIVVAHVNYGVRGTAAQRDEKHVARWAARLRLPCEILHAPTHMRGASEAVWRAQRYTFFENVRQKHNAHHIAVAHTKNDQAETLLLNLLRGSGVDGLRGMPYKNGALIRPLLNVGRTDTTLYCRENHVRYYNDATNRDTTFTRNRIRHNLLPHLARTYNPHIIDTLATTATLLAHDAEHLTQHPGRLWKKSASGRVMTCRKRAFVAQNVSTQRTMLRSVIQDMTGATHKPAFRTIENYRHAIASTKNKTQTVMTHGLKCHVKGDIVKFTRHTN